MTNRRIIAASMFALLAIGISRVAPHEPAHGWAAGSMQHWHSEQWHDTLPSGGPFEGGRVTTSAEGGKTYWIIWVCENDAWVKYVRIDQSDSTLSQGEKDALNDAKNGDDGVEITIDSQTNKAITGVTVVPGEDCGSAPM